MRDDLLFHITTEEEWNEYKSDGNYTPESLESEGFIHCSSGHQVNDTANRLFGDHDQILLLIIDVSSLAEEIKYEEVKDHNEKYPHIYGPLNTNAVIDELLVSSEQDGNFDIAFSSNS